MKLLALILLLSAVTANAGSSKKKTVEEALTTDSNLTELDDEPAESEGKPEPASSPPPAIIAIEILDPEDNSTEARSNTKRTIESNLGYGYNSGIYKTQKKFMIYPYSQKDIPATPKTRQQDGQRSVTIQKAITYNLGTRIEPEYKPTQPSAAYYPSTLYSTVQQNGQVGSLSTQFPGNYQGQTVPVIILRVYSNQLSNPHAGIYPNLPQSHPQAGYLNTVNLQELVARYYKQQQQQKLLYQAQYQGQYQTQQPAVYQSQQAVYQTQAPVYQAQSYQGQDYSGYQNEAQSYNQQANYQYQQTQPASQGYTQYQPVYQTQYQAPVPISDASTLPTHENYPDDKHTRVIYHSPRGHIQGGVSYSTLNMNYNSLAPAAKAPVAHYEYKDNGEKEQVVNIKPATHYNYDVSSQQAPSVYDYNTIKQSTAQYYPETNYKQNTIYTDNNGQSYIYVLPSQLQHQQQNDYAQNQLYYQQGYQSVDEPQSDDQTEAPYNYHAHETTKERNKKSSGSPVTFEDSNTKKKRS